MVAEKAWQQCINPDCKADYQLTETLSACQKCGNLLDVIYEWDRLPVPDKLSDFPRLSLPAKGLGQISGVWRFAKLLPFAPTEKQISIGEGHTQLRPAGGVAEYVGSKQGNVFLQYEGLNPSGSFKDNGMAGAFTHANMVGAKRAACASTGNTSASLAAFAAATKIMQAIIFIGSGKIAFGKLSQSLDFGAKTLQIAGDFDDAMQRVQEVCTARNIYLVNSLNPFRLEGQKTIMYRVLEGLEWQVPDWIVVPGGNLGNSSAFGKAFIELKKLNLIDKMPRLAVINSSGAPTLNNLVNKHQLEWNQGRVDNTIINDYYQGLQEKNEKAHTIASAIEINVPVNLKKCLRALSATNGVVTEVSDQEIIDAKAIIGREGIGCEPASAASVAGLKKLVGSGIIDSEAQVACVLTGHQLKDPNVTVGYHAYDQDKLRSSFSTYGISHNEYCNQPIEVENALEQILKVIED